MTTEHNEFADVAQIYMESLEANGVKLPSDEDMQRYRAAIAAEHEKMDAEDDSLRATYAVDLTNHDDHIAALSYTSGRYGFTVVARSMDEAATKVADRAMRDGFYDCGWSAQITRLRHAGASVMASWNPLDPQSQLIVALGGTEE